MRFWNREREKEWLKRYLKTEPNAILFVYGPKSSGKSTLMVKVAQELKNDPIEFLWYDLRKYAIEKMEDAISILLGAKGHHTALTKLFDINLFFVSIKAEELMKVFKKEKDPFVLLENELVKLIEKGKTPVIVFDEIQNFKDIYLNGERRLIDRLFNFFVAMTKVNHVSHVIVMTSDTFFIENVYVNSTLANSSRFYLVDFFEDDVATNILITSGFDEKTAREVVKKAGGVPWILEEVLEDGIEALNHLYNDVKSIVFETLRGRNDLKEMLKRALRGENLYYEEERVDLIKELVDKEILFMDPINMVIRFQTRLHKRACEELLEME